MDKAPLCYSIPGKVFLLGEYSVLAGKPAIVAATHPRFVARSDGSKHFSHLPHTASREFHPLSPAGLLERSKPAGIPHFEFHDAYQEQGGFGASTAQFALAYAMSGGGASAWNEVYHIYRALTRAEALPPSGADLVAQWMGGVIYLDPEKNECAQLREVFPWERLLIFSAAHQAGRKVATHEHLKIIKDREILEPSSPFLRETSAITREAFSVISAGGEGQSGDEFGKLLNSYGDVLSRFDLEIEATTADRESLRKVPGVLGVKGAGAMQSDCVIVWLKKDADAKKIIEHAHSLQLRWLVSGFKPETGIREEKVR